MPAEQIDLVPGEYTALGFINIRSAMDPNVSGNIVGGYTGSRTFLVYEVFPEKNGIVWGRVSSNAIGSASRYVALRVNNNFKAKLKRVFSETDQIQVSLAWINAIDAWARANNFNGPKPF